MAPVIKLSAPDVTAAEQARVAAAVARSDVSTTYGEDIDAFEHDAASRAGTSFAVSLSSGTAALHLALLSTGVRPGDLVPTSSMTFAATANAIRYAGATPVFIDSEPESGNIDVALLHQTLAGARRSRARIGAVMPVDLLGKAVDYTAITALCAEYDVPLVADAAESFGATHADRPVNSFGTASCVSFNGNKIMTTSGGGMLFTDDGALAARARYLASQARQPARHYQHTEIGYNYRLSNVLAALGRAQLERLDDMIDRRRAVRDQYRRVFVEHSGVRLLGGADDRQDNCWLTAIVVDPVATGWRAEELGQHLERLGIETRPLWKPMHLQPVHRDAPSVVTGAAESLFRSGLTLPSGSSLSDHDIERVCSSIADFVR